MVLGGSRVVFGGGWNKRVRELNVLTNDYHRRCDQCKSGVPMATEAQNAVVPECKDQDCTDYVHPPHAH